MRCRAFTITLKGPPLAWFNRLPPLPISSFRELSIAFVSHFIGAKTYRKPSYHLLTIKQISQESLRSYVQRFNAESLKVDIPDEKFAITAFIVELRVYSKDLMFSISKNLQAKKPSYQRKEALQPMKRKAGLTSDRDKAQRYKENGRGPQRKTENGPRKGVEASKIAWVHLSPSGDDSISLSAQIPAAQFDELDYSAQAMHPKSQISSGYSSHKASVSGA